MKIINDNNDINLIDILLSKIPILLMFIVLINIYFPQNFDYMCI